MTHRPADRHDQTEGMEGNEAHPPSKFTVLLDPDTTIGFDQLALDIRRLLGRRVSKGDLVRALIALAAVDPTLRAQLLDELRNRPTA